MKFSQKKYWVLAELENEFFWGGHFDFFFKKNLFFLLHLRYIRYNLFLHYGWFLQNLAKEAVWNNMHTTVPWILFFLWIPPQNFAQFFTFVHHFWEEVFILTTPYLVWPQWWIFGDVSQQGLNFSKKISKMKIFFWFDFHRCSHLPSKIGHHFRKQSDLKIEVFKKWQ